jgi:hypothetical protein
MSDFGSERFEVGEGAFSGHGRGEGSSSKEQRGRLLGGMAIFYFRTESILCLRPSASQCLMSVW